MKCGASCMRQFMVTILFAVHVCSMPVSANEPPPIRLRPHGNYYSPGYCPIPAHHPDFAKVRKSYPITNYASFPVPVRCLMQYADIEGDICKGIYHGALTESACDRRDRMMKRIELTGWCWDSPTGISADEYWMRCSDSPGYAYRHGLPSKAASAGLNAK